MVADDIEMPSYNVRHSIATKVAAKKTAKGYTLSDKRCSDCEMPLMTLAGDREGAQSSRLSPSRRLECKVCPAIKKWVQRKNELNSCSKSKEDDAITSYEAEDARKEAKAIPNKVVVEANKMVAETAATDKDADVLGEVPPAAVVTDCVSTEEKQAKNFVHVEPFRAGNESQDLQIDAECFPESDEMKTSVNEIASGISEIVCEDIEGGDQCLAKSGSEESDETRAIRARARQIILNARGGNRGVGGWDSDSNDSDEEYDDEHSIESPTNSWASENSKDASTVSSLIQERAGQIIHQARKNLAEENGFDLPPGTMKTIHMHVAEEQSISTDEEISREIKSLEATTIIQSAARRYLAKSLFLRMMYQKSAEYQESDKEAVEMNAPRESDVVDQKPSLQFEPLGVSAPTSDDDEGSNNAPVEKNKVQDKQDEYFSGIIQDQQESFVQNVAEEDVTQDYAQGIGFDDRDNTVSNDNQDSLVMNMNSAKNEPHYLADDQYSGHNNPEVDVTSDIVLPPQEDSWAPKVHNSIPPQQEVPISDYAAVEQNKPVVLQNKSVALHNEPVIQQREPCIVQREEEHLPVSTLGPRRGLFAELACKFDDAVNNAMGKMHSIVTCNMTNDENNGFGSDGLAPEYYVNHAPPRSEHPVDTHVAPHTEHCNVNAATSYDNVRLLHQETTVNKYVPDYPENIANHAVAQVGHIRVRPHQEYVSSDFVPPHSEYPVGQSSLPPLASHQTNPAHVISKPNEIRFPCQGPIATRNNMCQEPIIKPASSSHIYNAGMNMNKLEQMGDAATEQDNSDKNNASPLMTNHGSNFNSVECQSPSATGLPVCEESTVNHAPRNFLPTTNTSQSQLNSIEMNCDEGMAPNPSPQMPTKPSNTPLGGCQSHSSPLRDVTASYYASQTKSMVLPPHNPTNKAYPTTATVVSSKAQQNAPTPSQSQMIDNINKMMQMQNLQTASAPQVRMMQDARDLIMKMQQTPRHNTMMIPAGKAKENSSRDANVSKQLNEAELRIADAKNFILSRNSRRALKPQGNMSKLPSPHEQQVFNPTHTGIFRLQIGTTLSSHTQYPINPCQAGTTTAGMRQMESLISPTEESDNARTARLNAAFAPDQMQIPHQSRAHFSQIGGGAHVSQISTTPGSQQDDFLTPDMPGRYFFA